MIEALAAAHARAVAALHAEAFPESFLTRLGPRVLARFYAEFAASEAGLGYVATEDGRIVGFVVATRSPASFFGGFYRRNLLLVAGAVTRALARDPRLRRHARSRAGHLRYLVGGRPPAPAAAPPVAGARLLSIAVAPAARGRGIADALVDACRARLAADGVGDLGLSVLKANAAARRFYARTGWSVERETEDALYLHRPTG
ncbi:MAG TPA: GNAT family N-acetyltransferase [Solirubrobacteraceae bacterium]|jgi:ribosomal protein S18 acetylase RimI-like enzyme